MWHHRTCCLCNVGAQPELFSRPDHKILKGHRLHGLSLRASSYMWCHSIEAATPRSAGEPCEGWLRKRLLESEEGSLVTVPEPLQDALSF